MHFFKQKLSGIRQPSIVGIGSRWSLLFFKYKKKKIRWKLLFTDWRKRAGLSIARPFWGRSNLIGNGFGGIVIRVYRGKCWRATSATKWQVGWTWGSFAQSRKPAFFNSKIRAKKLAKSQRNKEEEALRAQPKSGRPGQYNKHQWSTAGTAKRRVLRARQSGRQLLRILAG